MLVKKAHRSGLVWSGWIAPRSVYVVVRVDRTADGNPRADMDERAGFAEEDASILLKI